MINRAYDDLDKLLAPGKALVIYGPRRVGKTTLLQRYLSDTDLTYKLDSGDNILTEQILSSRDFEQILGHVEGLGLYVIDEAQNISSVGVGLKIIVDQRPDIRVLATGSSSFDLASNVGEPLTGRKTTIVLYPIAQLELLATGSNRSDLKQGLEDYLIFGSYPDVINTKTRAQKIATIEELVGSALLRDILALDKVKSSAILVDLLRLLAFQVGSEVSLNELATQLNINVRTVGRYLDLLEKSFIVMRLGAFSRNLRSEIARKSKYYFVDNGVRNGVISQFNSLGSRNDVGQLWENFIFSERMKKRAYDSIYGSNYFWRTYQGQEIDFLEERDGKLLAYECKWSSSKTSRPPVSWAAAYPDAAYKVINRDNYLDFIIGPRNSE